MKGGVVPNKFNIDISGVLNKKMKTGIADLRGVSSFNYRAIK